MRCALVEAVWGVVHSLVLQGLRRPGAQRGSEGRNKAMIRLRFPTSPTLFLPRAQPMLTGLPSPFPRNQKAVNPFHWKTRAEFGTFSPDWIGPEKWAESLQCRISPTIKMMSSILPIWRTTSKLALERGFLVETVTSIPTGITEFSSGTTITRIRSQSKA